MFVILQVPNLLESAFNYLHYNYMPHTQGVAFMLPSRAYGLMRAFWVGLVGLLTGFPSGIRYGRVPSTTPYAQQRMANELRPLDRNILWLDKRCNSVFALAFQSVFLLVLIALLYLQGLLIYLVIQPDVPAGGWFGIKIALGLLVILFHLTALAL